MIEGGDAMREETTIADRRPKEGYAGFIIFLGIALALSFTLIFEENSGSPRGFYERCLDQKIVQCEPSAWIYSAGADVRASYDQALKRARFYEDERERLIALMEEQSLGKDPQRVEYFLRKAYYDFLQSSALRAHR